MICPMISQVLTLTTLIVRHTNKVQGFNPIFPQPAIRSILNSDRSPYTSNLAGKKHTNNLLSVARMSSTSTSSEMKKRVLVPIAEGSEEIETSAITDVLTRFGAEVVVASVMPDLVCTMSRGLKICADVSIEDASKEDWDLIALPGGLPGANHLRDSTVLVKLLKTQKEKKKLYGAVCASPAVVLQTHGLLSGPGATCYPAPQFRSTMEKPSDDKVVVQENIVTSQGPGTSLLFALSLGEQLFGKAHADKVADGLLVQR